MTNWSRLPAKKFLPVFLLVIFFLTLTACTGGEMKIPEGQSITLRSQYKTLSIDDVKAMIKQKGFYDNRRNAYGGFPNRFALKIIAKDHIVIDSATRLTWSRFGSEYPLAFGDAVVWLASLNEKGYAGYNDWRLPTLEEAASLSEKEKIDRYHIGPMFSRSQFSTWTGDNFDKLWQWALNFQYGMALKCTHEETNFVRPVRSGI